MDESRREYRRLVAVYPAAEIDTLYAQLCAKLEELEELEGELLHIEAAALRAEARLEGYQTFDSDLSRVTARTERVLEDFAADAKPEAHELMLAARRVAAQRVGEAAADAERRIADARAHVERTLTPHHLQCEFVAPPAVEPLAVKRNIVQSTVVERSEVETPVESVPVEPTVTGLVVVESATTDTTAVERLPTASTYTAHDDFWPAQVATPWYLRLPATVIVQLIGALLVLVLILVRVG